MEPQLSLLRAKDDSSCTGNSVTLIMCLFFPFPPSTSFSSFFLPPPVLPSYLLSFLTTSYSELPSILLSSSPITSCRPASSL